MKSWERVEPPTMSTVAWICRHKSDDPSCSSHPSNRQYVEASAPRSRGCEPGTDYEVENAEEVCGHLVMQVRYSSTFEGTKTMVFLNVKTIDALRWKKIDPHFTRVNRGKNEAPAPAARFPSTAAGWADAVAYARGKVGNP